MKDAQLSKAETETKELIAKLEHLRNLLLAEDLDFQLKLARLRQMRETLGQLERIVKEERRELGWSRFAMEQRKRLERFAARRPDLEALVRDQQAVIADTKNASKNGEKSAKDARAAIREREVKLRNAATALATDPLFADLQPPHLRRADAHLADAVTSLEGADVERRRRGRGEGTRPAARGAHSPGRTGGADGANDRRGRIPAPRRGSSQEPRHDRTPRGDLGPAGRRRRRLAKRPDPRQRIDAVGRARPGQDRGRPGGR